MPARFEFGLAKILDRMNTVGLIVAGAAQLARPRDVLGSCVIAHTDLVDIEFTGNQSDSVVAADRRFSKMALRARHAQREQPASLDSNRVLTVINDRQACPSRLVCRVFKQACSSHERGIAMQSTK